MKKILTLLLALSFSSVFGQTLAVRGILQDSLAKSEIFKAQISLSPNNATEIFTGPYTLKFTAQKSGDSLYDIATELFGLGPTFHNTTYNLKIAIGDSLPVPAQPVKDGQTIIYTIALLSDSSSIETTEPAFDDTTSWGSSISVHYQTHWLKGSYADFLWNLKMGYLENVYDRYRSSFKLSMFEKIDYYFHPNPQTTVYLNPQTNYAIQPGKRRIDLVFGHDIDVATPRLAAELLLYSQWGYGPRWMVTGFSGYYEDNFLRMRELADIFPPAQLARKFADESWVNSDTGRIVTGAFCRWLADSQIFSKFMDLYRQSTELNFQTKYEKIYGATFDKAAEEFLKFANSYKPKEVELEYYASEYLGRGYYEQADEYFREGLKIEEKRQVSFKQSLALCDYWLGEYKAACDVLGPDTSVLNCDKDIFRINVQVANGSFDPPTAFKPLAKIQCAEAIEALSMYYLDHDLADSAAAILEGTKPNDRNTIDYFLAWGYLKVIQGQNADSTLAMAAAIALGQAQTQPNEPVNYLSAGQAFLLMKKYDRAKENLDIANFLEKRPYFQGCILLELGKLADLQSQRDQAIDYYNLVLEIKSGAYQKSLAKLYLKKKYDL
jgi:hypothetical protein